eukprot:gene1000-biopygen3979
MRVLCGECYAGVTRWVCECYAVGAMPVLCGSLAVGSMQ